MNPYFREITINNLTDFHLNQLYDIHYRTYQRKNTGVIKDLWISNLQKNYHNHSKKQLFIFSYLGGDSLFDGYLITAGTQIINNQPWLKILEGASSPNGSYVSPVCAFTEMFRHFLVVAKQKQWNLWGEVSLHHLGIFELMVNNGFSPISNVESAYSLYKTFIPQKSGINIFSINGTIEVERQTRITANYQGKLINFIQNHNINLIKQSHYYEHY